MGRGLSISPKPDTAQRLTAVTIDPNDKSVLARQKKRLAQNSSQASGAMRRTATRAFTQMTNDDSVNLSGGELKIDFRKEFS